MAKQHVGPEYCRKEAEIAKMQSELETIKGYVMGKDGLIVLVPKLIQSVDTLVVTVTNLDRNVDRVIGKQDHYEGEKDGKNIIRKRNKWIIGILITLATSLLGTILFLIDKVMNHLPV